MNRRKPSMGKPILILLCIVLCGVLCVFLLWNRREEQETIRQLQQEMEKMNQSEETETEQRIPADQDESALKPEEENLTEREESQETSPEEEDVQGISFRGDSFISEERKEDKGYAACFKNSLSENNLTMEVNDYTMDAAGSLSQMKLAGVAWMELDAYVQHHQENAGGSQLRITETKIRELTEEELIRDDRNCIPVICMGYYGGWGDDLNELFEQQQKILDTYQQREKYLILGVCPSVYNNREEYHRVMSEKWGNHYLRLDGEIRHSLLTDDAKKEIADKVYEKMESMGYLL